MTYYYKLLGIRELIFIGMFLVLFTSLQLVDPDYFYHVKTGGYIIQNMALPQGDIFSNSVNGKHWVVHEWLFEVLLYVTKLAAGDWGIKLLTTSLFVMSLIITYLTMNKLNIRFIVICPLLLIAYWLTQGGLSPRPHLTTYVFYTYYLSLLLSFKYLKSSQFLWTIPIVMLIWTNAHGGYVLGVGILGLFLLAEWVTIYINSQHDAKFITSLKKLSVIVLVTVLSTGIKPTGFSEWLFPFQITSMKHLIYVQEWQSPSFHDLSGRLYLLLVLIFFVSNIYRKHKPDLTELLLPIVLLVLGFISQRHVPLAALTLIIFIGMAIQDVHLSPIKNIWQRLGLKNAYTKYIGGGKQLGDTEYILNWMLLLVMLLVFALYYPTYQLKQVEKNDEAVPNKAYAFIEKNGITGKVFNTQPIGGYLISKLYPNQGVFIDGRGGDLYGDKFTFEYMTIYGVGEGWEKLFNQYQIDYLLIDHKSALGQLLSAQNRYKLVYDDKYYSVLVKNEGKFESIIQKYAIPDNINLAPQHKLSLLN